MRHGEQAVLKTWEKEAFPFRTDQIAILNDVLPEHNWYAVHKTTDGDYIHLLTDRSASGNADKLNERFKL